MSTDTFIDLAEEWQELWDREYGDIVDDTNAQQRFSELRDIAQEIGCDDPSDLLNFPNHNTVIEESDWDNYAQEMAYDTGMVERDSTIDSYVDWEKWANDLRMDYCEVEVDGRNYLYR